MIIRHFFLALAVALAWGANFSIMKIGLNGMSPLIFSALRSVLILPLLFFIPKPKISWKIIIIIGLLIGTIKLPLMLLAIHLGVATGLSSLIVQVQAFFTTLLALMLFNQKPTIRNWIGMSVAFAGIGLISIQVGGEASTLGLIVILIAALFWAISNLLLQQKGQNVDMLSLMAWMNLVPPIPLFFLSITLYGWENCLLSFQNFTWITGSSLTYASFCAGLFGYTIWGMLLKKYPAAVVAPFSLLVPVFGIGFAYLFIDETLTATSIYGCFLVIFGLVINQLNPNRLRIKNSSKTISKS
jgi:O-acetylserine/cysteine efflux transporter